MVKKIKKVLSDNKKIITEFNQDLKLDLTNIKTNNKINDNRNNFGIQNYDGSIKKIGNIKSFGLNVFSWTNLLDQDCFLPLLSLRLGYFPVIIFNFYFKNATNVIYTYIVKKVQSNHDDSWKY